MSSVKVSVVGIFALMALSMLAAGPAQAFESEWMIEGETLSESKKVSLVSKPVSLSVPSLSITIECKKAEGSGTIFKGGTEELKATLTSCTVAKLEACKVESLVVEAKLEMIYTGSVYYDKVESPKEGTPLSTVVIKGTECPLSSKNKEGVVKGAFSAETSLKEELEPPLKFAQKTSEKVNAALKEEEKSELSLKYNESTAYFSGEFVPPLNIPPNNRLQQVPFTRLCEVQVGFCGGGSIYPQNTLVQTGSEGAVTFRLGTTPVIEATCAESEFEAKTNFAGGAPLVGTSPLLGLEFNNCGGCSSVAVGMPYVVQFVTTGGGNGYVIVRKPSFKIVCGGKTCVYGATEIPFWITGGAPAKFKVDPQILQKEMGSDAACVGVGNWEMPLPTGGPMFYKVFNPKPTEKGLWVTG
jgi:hypothetical protein